MAAESTSTARIEIRRSTLGLEATAYPETKRGFLRMDSNTNLLGANPVLAAVLRKRPAVDLNQYPPPHCDELRRALGRKFGSAMEETIVGNGSDELLDLVLKAFINPGDFIVVPRPSFVMYGFYGRVNGAYVAEVPLRPGFQLDVDGILAVNGKVTFLATPNNPTGNAWSSDDIAHIVRHSRGLVVIDEAYAEYCGAELIRHWRTFKNVIVLRTFSKAHGLAGIRVGYGMGPARLIGRMLAVKAPYTVSALSERIAMAALRDSRHVMQSVRLAATEAHWLAQNFRKLRLLPCPTDANFMLVDAGRPAAPLVRALARRRILVRDMTGGPGLDNFFRTTIGRRQDNERLVAALARILR